MGKNKKEIISEELLAAYLDGNTTPEETMQIINALEEDECLQEILVTSERVDRMLGNNFSEYPILPMDQMAAKTKDNLCDFQCETYILQKKGVVFDEAILSDDAKRNCWLKEKGTPLYNVGRLLEQEGFSVNRKYDSSLNDLQSCSAENGYSIVIVDNNVLQGNDSLQNKYNDEDNNSYHAVVFLNCDDINKIISFYDPASEKETDHCEVKQFLDSWRCSRSYMVSIKEKSENNKFDPKPINLDDVQLTNDLLDLREAIAENAHNVWGAARLNEGWTYGPARNDELKQNPDLVPYSDLPDSEKQYDRDLAMETIKLVKKIGFDLIKKRKDSDHYNLLTKRLSDIEENNCHCSKCGAPIFKDQIYCGECGNKITWKDMI